MAQNDIVTGRILDAEFRNAIIGVHIRNMSTGNLAISDPDGSFKISADAGDTLLLSHVGFQSIEWKVHESLESTSPIEFFLVIDAIYLQEVQIGVFPDYQRFKQLILETEPVDSVITFDLPVSMMYRGPTAQQLQDPMLAPSMGIRFDLGGLTKKGKEQKKYQKLLERQAIKKLAYNKFNRDWVSQVTDLLGEELTDFIAYCNLDVDYLAEASLFEIKNELMVLLKEFQSADKRSKKEQFTPGA